MQFDGRRLSAILSHQPEPVDVFDHRSSPVATVSAEQALGLCAGGATYVGIGNKRRIRYIRRLSGALPPDWMLRVANTVQRIRDANGKIIAPRPHIEHRTAR